MAKQKSKHTAGPWASEDLSNGKYMIYIDDLDASKNECIAVIDNEHNVPIIKSAPDMLAALKKIDDILDGYDQYNHLWLNHPDKPVLTPRKIVQNAIKEADPG